MKKGLDFIWNMSLICPWSCSICSVDAVNVKSSQNRIIISSNRLTKNEVFDKSKEKSIFDQALIIRQKNNLELSLQDKLKIVNNLGNSYNIKIDFSGGDPLVCSENLEVIKYASQKYGKENILVTTTSIGLSEIDLKKLVPFVSSLEFTYDTPIDKDIQIRPKRYNKRILEKVTLLQKEGVEITALIPLSKRIIKEDMLRLLYKNLHDADIKNVELMRYFTVGRGFDKSENTPNLQEYKKAIEIFQNLEKKFRYPIVKLQCALKNLNRSLNKNPCDMYRESFGINYKGLLLTSAWAMNSNGQPLNEIFVLGSLLENNIDKLLKDNKNKEKIKQYKTRINDNFGHCKVFSFLNSRKQNPFDRLFDKSDPLYVVRKI